MVSQRHAQSLRNAYAEDQAVRRLFKSCYFTSTQAAEQALKCLFIAHIKTNTLGGFDVPTAHKQRIELGKRRDFHNIRMLL